MQRAKLISGVSIFVAALLLIVNPVSAVNNTRKPGIKDILTLEIPSSWGIIKESFNAGTDKLIINIQDAHCDFEAQQNISKILDRLVADYQLKLIALEGAAGEINNPILSQFPEKKVRRDISLHFVREGKLTGAEYLAINSDYRLKLYGVEDMKLYMENLEVLRQSQPFKEEAKKYFAILKKALDDIKPYVYNDALKNFDVLQIDYELKKISFDEYAISVFKLLEKHNLRRMNYPMFYDLQKVIELEKKVDFQKADTERTRLIMDLTQTIKDKKDISDLVEKSLNFRKGLVSAAEFVSFLKDLAFKMKINMVYYPNFNAYSDYIIRYEQVANEKLFDELAQIGNDLKNALYTDEDQKKLDILYKNLDVLIKMVDLKMVTEDVEYYFAHRDQMNTDEFIRFVEPQAYKHNVIVSLPAEISYVDVYLPAWVKFYQVANMRDIVFVDKTLQQMEEERVNFAALVTGGFHTEKLTEILKEKQVSYMVITPKASIRGESPYFNIIQGGSTVLEEFAKQLQSTLMPEIKTEQEDAAQMLAVVIVTTASVLTEQSQESINDQGGLENAVKNKFEGSGFKVVEGGVLDRTISVVADGISQSGEQFVIKRRTDVNNVVVYDPKATEPGKIFSVKSLAEITVDTGKPASISVQADATGYVGSVSPSSAKDVFKRLAEKSELPLYQLAAVVEEVLTDLLAKGTVDAKQVASRNPQLENVENLQTHIQEVETTALNESLKNSGEAGIIADSVISELGITGDDNRLAQIKDIIKENLADINTLSFELNEFGIKVDSSQISEAVNEGVVKTSKFTAKSVQVISDIINELGVTANEQVKNIVTESFSNAKPIKSMAENLAKSEEQVAQAVNKAVLKSIAADNPIFSDIGSRENLVISEQENSLSSELTKYKDSIFNIEEAMLSKSVPEGQGFAVEGGELYSHLATAVEKVGIDKARIKEARFVSGDYKNSSKVNVKITPTSDGKFSLTIAPEKGATISKYDQSSTGYTIKPVHKKSSTSEKGTISGEISKEEIKLELTSRSGTMEDEFNPLNVIAFETGVKLVSVQNDMLREKLRSTKEDFTEATSTVTEEKAPITRERNVIFVSLSMFADYDFDSAADVDKIEWTIHGVINRNHVENISKLNEIVIVQDQRHKKTIFVDGQEKEVDVTFNKDAFAKLMNIEGTKITYIDPYDVGAVKGEPAGVGADVTPKSAIEVLTKQGVKMGNICFVTQEDTTFNKQAKELLVDSRKDDLTGGARVYVTEVKKPEITAEEKIEIIIVDQCLNEALYLFIAGETIGGKRYSQLSSDEQELYKLTIMSILGDQQLIIDINSDEDFFKDDGVTFNTFKANSKLATVDMKDFITVYIAAETFV